tara:strand:+ start:100 stop:327 length:228 start_codon:yes stop_codon:yes gene_type:complete
MKLKGAMTILKKDMEFLGLTFDQLCIFIERNPYAQKNSTIDAYTVYKQSIDADDLLARYPNSLEQIEILKRDYLS